MASPERYLRPVIRVWARRFAWAAGAYLALGAIAWACAPWALRKALPLVPEKLPGFSAGVEEIVLNPLTLRLTLRRLSLRHQRLGELASCAEFSAALNPLSFFRLAVGLREIRLQNPTLTFVLAEDGTSVLDALPRSAPDAPKSSGPAFIPRVVIGAFEVAGGALEFESRLPKAPQKVSARPISFRLENLSTIPKDDGRYSLQARTDRGERLLWEGTLTLRPLRLAGRVALENADLSRAETAAPGLPVAIEGGRLDASTGYELSLPDGVLSASLKDARLFVRELLWRLKDAKEAEARGPFELKVGPGQATATVAAMGTPEAKISAHVDIPVESGVVRVRAHATPAPLAGGVELDVESLPLAPFSPLAPPPTQLSIDGGTLSVRARADYAQGQVEGQASMSVAAFKLSAKSGKQALAGFGRFVVESAKFSTKARRASVESVSVDSPLLRLFRAKDGKTNVETALGLSFSSAAAPAGELVARSTVPAAAGAPWKVALKRFSLNGGRLLVQDEGIVPSFALSVTQARASLAGLANDARSTATFSASAKVEQAPVSAEGGLRVSTNAAWGQALLKGRDIQLPVFSAYSGKYAGYKLDKGAFAFELDHRIDGRMISTRNRAIIDQFEFGEKVESPDALKLPVKLGVAILKDKNGVIDLAVPVDGSLDDPEFHVFGAVIKTLGNLIVKAALSPFSALSSMMGGKEDMGKLAFDPGDAAVTEAMNAQLDRVAKVLADRPQFFVGVRGAATKADAMGRADQPAKKPLGDAELRALALARAGAVKEALLARGVAPERFFSLEPVAGAEAPDEPTQLQLDLR